ncbi:MAG: hypothetical protein U1E81_16115 [Xanthobacteraceae bacterium]
MSTIDRRTVLTGAAAAVPAIALAAAPALAAPAFASPDAELIELGRQLEAFLPRYAERLAEASISGWAAKDLARTRSGIADLPEGVSPNPEQWRRYDEEIRIAERETGFLEKDAAWDAMASEADRLSQGINARMAMTRDGLWAKTLNACLMNLHVLRHDMNDVEEGGPSEVREMVIAVLAVLGAKLPEGLPAGGSLADV